MEINETKLSLMRRYPLETLITALFLCVTVLAGVVYNSNQRIEELHDNFQIFLKEDNKMLLEAMQKNTEAINKFLDREKEK